MKIVRVTLTYLMELEVPDEYKENDIYNQAVAEIAADLWLLCGCEIEEKECLSGSVFVSVEMFLL